MPMITPLPSPRGTNHERLYIDAAWLGHSGIAYDSKFGLDEQPEPSKASRNRRAARRHVEPRRTGRAWQRSREGA